MNKIKDIPNNERPRERAIALGVENLSNEELLSIIQYMEITDDEEYLDAIKHDIVLDNDTLCELCASYSDKQILTAFENVFDEFVAKSDDEQIP